MPEQETIADWIDEIYKDIDCLRRLATNWDSYGAEPALHESLDRARILAHKLAKFEAQTGVLSKPCLGCDPSGKVAFFWLNGGRELDVEVVPGEEMLRFAKLDEREQGSEGVCGENELLELVRWVAG